MSEFLFVYGTLRPGAGHALHPVLLRETEFVARASLPGRLYDLGHYPGAIPDTVMNPLLQAAPDRQARGWVSGDLYRLVAPQVLLPVLDRYEGCTSPEDQTPVDLPAEYRREVCTVWQEDGSTCAAWVYVYNRPCDGLAVIDSGDFLKR